MSGWAALTAAGPERGDVTAALRSGRPGVPTDVPAAYGDVPGGRGYLLDLDPRSRLGRKGTSALDRGTGLALLAAGAALDHSGLTQPNAEPAGTGAGAADAGPAGQGGAAVGTGGADAGRAERLGVVLGTSVGGFRATMEYSLRTLVDERPYLVSPARFPTTVMNCAAGQVAIRYGLRGVNATVAGGRLAFLQALRFAQNALHHQHADALLVGAVEEYSAQHAWRTYRTGDPTVPAGEAAVVAAVQRAEDVAAPVAELLAVAVGFAPGDEQGDEQGAALGACALRCLRRAEVDPGDVTLLATGELTPADRTESAAVERALGPAFSAERVLVAPVLGDCQAAAGGLALTGLLARATAPGFGLLTGRTPAGAIGAALWRLPAPID
ncbi:MAG TPA: beta-ketoacyl synthase N-terminal-like domain-containing protein [Mycobacteriales bacterium]|nr:beta-ketoacyl synthase N-terminal-like domain-containing protein [Mycobacteriales bacterium]